MDGNSYNATTNNTLSAAGTSTAAAGTVGAGKTGRAGRAESGRSGRVGKSPEQRQAERESLLASLGGKVAALADSAEWVAYLRFMRAFRRYSFNNLMLIAVQRPGATHVAGFRAWQQLDRQVRKGEKAIRILGYSTKKITTTNPVTGEEVEDKVKRFPVLSVFDVSQTDGGPVPADGYALPTGEGPVGALDRLTGWLVGEGWSVRRLPLAGMMEGYTDHQRRIIATEVTLSPAARLVVLLHEATHALLHDDSAAYVERRGLCETEAESAAYVLAGLLGVDVDASSISYVAGWSASDPAVFAAAASNVLRAVNIIAAALGLDDDNSTDADQDRDQDAAVGQGVVV